MHDFNKIINLELNNEILEFDIRELGKEILVIINGPGQHIGAVSMGQPYVRKNGEKSASSSTLTQYHHRDNELTQLISQKLSKSLQKVVVVLGGIHIEGITIDQLNEVMEKTNLLIEEAIKEFNK